MLTNHIAVSNASAREFEYVSNTSLIIHSIRVEKIALKIAEKLGCLTDQKITELSLGCIFHDIGKLQFPKMYFEKTKLLPEEYATIKRHPLSGYLTLRDSHIPKAAAEIALFHHERFDGNGYPFGLKGREIPLLARICSIADAFDAMYRGRSYQNKKTYEETLTEIQAHSGTQFDPDLVDIFFR